MAKKRTLTEVVIGTFYQRSTDPMDIVYTVGGGPNNIYGYDAKQVSFNATPEKVMTWTQLAVNDFPHSSDPRLPYVYDLHWDIKRISQLRFMDPREREEIEELLVLDFGIKNPLSNLGKLTTAVQLRNDIDNEYIESPLKAKRSGTLRVNEGPSL
jgi:hypothetical protein